MAASAESEPRTSGALVTGAAGAIGSEVVRAFSRTGYRVVGHDLREQPRGLADSWVQGEIAGMSGREAVREAHRRLGRLNILIHCAGGADPRPLLELSDAEWDEVLELNGSATFRVSQEAARYMVEHGGGVIVIVSSLCGRLAWQGFAHYCAAKAATDMICRSLAVELGPFGVRVNAVVPGTVDTPLTDRVGLDEDARRRLLARTPARRIATPEEIAEVALWLASAPTFLTGETIVVDGGYSIEGTP